MLLMTMRGRGISPILNDGSNRILWKVCTILLK